MSVVHSKKKNLKTGVKPIHKKNTHKRNHLIPLTPRICLERIDRSLNNEDTITKVTSNNVYKLKRVVRKLNFDSNKDISASLEISSKIPTCNKDLGINLSIKTARKCKRNFCHFCKQLFCQLPRHLESAHSNEEEVKKIIFLPKGSEERKILLDLIRKKGNLEFNTNSTIDSDNIIACRKIRNKDTANLSCCIKCKGFFSKCSIRKHYIKCCNSKKGDRMALVNGRRILRKLHPCASNILKNKIFPVLRDDDVINCIRCDEIAIKFANKLCEKYRSEHHQKMIRARIRLIGRFLLNIKNLDQTVTDLKSVFLPQRYDVVIHAVNNVAHFNEGITKYQSPTTASELGTLLKKIGRRIIIECIKNNDSSKKKDTEEFLLLLQEDFVTSVNKTVRENQLEIKRMKKTILPSMDDIKSLNTYLSEECDKLFKKLKQSFNLKTWKDLSACVLTSIQVFNRRRAGEIERMTVNDVENYECLDENFDNDIYKSLSKKSQEATKQYVRFTIRGKLGRNVPVLLSSKLLQCVKLLMKHRKDANIPKDNCYVFAVPHASSGIHHLDACTLLRQYSELCGAKNPESLRGTHLRKHIATSSVLLNLQDSDVADLANYMGHTEKIHREHYRMPIVARDITIMSRLLQQAQGTNDDSGEEIESNKESETWKKNKVSEINESEEKIEACEDNETRKENKEINTDNSEEDIESDKDSEIWEEKIEDCRNNETKKNNREINRCTDNIHGRIIRRTWSTPEKKVAKQSLCKYIEIKKLPSLKTCFDVIKCQPVLQTRSAQQLKLWVHNYISRQKQVTNLSTGYRTPTKKVNSTTSWITPERLKMRKVFAYHLDNKTLPSKMECIQAIQQHSILRNRKITSVKAWVYNEINRRQNLQNQK